MNNKIVQFPQKSKKIEIRNFDGFGNGNAIEEQRKRIKELEDKKK